MLSFFYTSDYDKSAIPLASTTTPTKSSTGKDLQLHVNVYIIAEKYDVPALKVVAANKYKECLGADWGSISTSFVATLKLIYDGLPDNDPILKNIAIEYAGRNAKNLAENSEYAILCKERGDIAFDVFRASATGAKPGPKVVLKASATKSTAKPVTGPRCPQCFSNNTKPRSYRLISWRCNNCTNLF
jgi:hypothetical protein